MPQTWHEVQLASYVPEEVRAIIGTTPVYRAGKVEIVAGRIICIYGILVAVLAVIFVGIGIGEMAKTGWSELLVRVGLGLALGWVAWLILSYWHRQRQLPKKRRKALSFRAGM
jgi:predicted phage tail protein